LEAGLLGVLEIVAVARVMGILSDSQIRKLIGIEPFEENAKRPGRVSYGVFSYGNDIRVGSVSNVNSQIIDPKCFSDRAFVTADGSTTGL